MRHVLILTGLLILASHDGAAQLADPVSESCSITDETACDDGNPCTEDGCFQKLRPIDNLEFRFNGVCTHTVIEGCAVGLPPPPPVVTPVETPVDTTPPAVDPVPPPGEDVPVADGPTPEAPAPEAPAAEELEGPVCGNRVVDEGEECDSSPACDVACRFNLEDFPDCRIPEDELRAMEPSQIIAKYGYDEFEKCVLAGGGAGVGLEKAAKNHNEASGGCSLVAAETLSSGPRKTSEGDS